MVAVPSTVPAALSRYISKPDAAATVNRGVRTLVIPSPFVPESSAASKLGAAGAAGGVVRIRRLNEALRGLAVGGGVERDRLNGVRPVGQGRSGDR